MATTRPVYIDPNAPDLAERAGLPPLTTSPSLDLAHPHQQLTQTADTRLADELVERARRLPGIRLDASCVSVPGARAFHLDDELASGPGAAFQCRTEFAHVHPAGDGSLHMTLPPLVRNEVLEKGWGEPHPISGTMLVFGPRDRYELEVIWQLVITSYRYALGTVHVDDERVAEQAVET